MRVIVDANIVAAALVRPLGWTASQLARRDVGFYAPGLLALELQEHGVELSVKAGCDGAEWQRRVRGLLRQIRLVPQAQLSRHRRHPLVRAVEAVDVDDGPYAAAFVAVNADFVWTRDQALRAVFAERAGPLVPSSGVLP